MEYIDNVKTFFFLRFYLLIHERHRERERETERDRERQRQREKQAPGREPNVRLDPGTPGSCPGSKADALPLSHPGIPINKILKKKKIFLYLKV